MWATVVLLARLRAVLDTATDNYPHISESVVASLDTLGAHSVLTNTSSNGSALVMRAADGSGSLVTISDPSTTDGWAVELRIPSIRLRGREKAGIFLWCTREQLHAGPFRGGSSKFTGFVAGIEFAAGRTELVFSYNYGLDYKDRGEAALHRDHINPDVLVGVDEVTVKIVHTARNFIIELYDGERLIADSFRIHDGLLPVEGGGGNHLALTTSYEECRADVALELRGLRILAREEGEGYDPAGHHVAHNGFVRAEDRAEVLHAVAGVEHFMAYAGNALGTGERSVLSEAQERLKEAVRRTRAGVDEMLVQAREAQAAESGGAAGRSMARIGDLEERLGEIHAGIERQRTVLQELGAESRGLSARGVGLVLAALAGLAVLWRWLARGRVSGPACAKKE